MEIESLLQKRFVILAFVLTVVFILICPNAAAGTCSSGLQHQ